MRVDREEIGGPVSLSGKLLEVPACLFAQKGSQQFVLGISGLRRRRAAPAKTSMASGGDGLQALPKVADARALVETLEVAVARRLLGLALDAALAAFALHALQRHMAHSMQLNSY